MLVGLAGERGEGGYPESPELVPAWECSSVWPDMARVAYVDYSKEGRSEEILLLFDPERQLGVEDDSATEVCGQCCCEGGKDYDSCRFASASKC